MHKFGPSFPDLRSTKRVSCRRMGSTALGECGGGQRKVLTHVLLSGLVLLAYLVTPVHCQILTSSTLDSSQVHASSSAVSTTTQTTTTTATPHSSSSIPSTAHKYNQTSAETTTPLTIIPQQSPTPTGTIKQTSTALAGVNNTTTVMVSINTTSSPSTSGTTNQENMSSTEVNTMTTTMTSSSYFTSGTTNQTNTTETGVNATTMMSTLIATTISSGTTNQTSTFSTAVNTTATPITSIANTSSYSPTGTTNQTSTFSTAVNTTATPITSIANTSSYSPTVSVPTSCNFSLQCDKSVYYWMTISVGVTGIETDVANITARLQDLFLQHLSECNSNSTFNTTSTSTLQVTSESSNGLRGNSMASSRSPGVPRRSLTTVQTSDNSSVTQVDTTTNIFKSIEVMCDNKTRNATECDVVLQLTQETDQCCIVSIVDSTNSTKIEKVAKGLCASNATAPSAENFEKCNGSLNSELSCNSNATVNISCSGQTGTVYVSLDNQDEKNCSSNNVDPQKPCYCTAFCNSTAAYYTMDIEITDPSSNIIQIGSLISNTTCNNTNPGCQALHNLSMIYENSTVQCDPQANSNTCYITVKLQNAMDTCSVSSALMFALQNENAVLTYGMVSRVAAICSWWNEDVLQLYSQIQYIISSSISDICMVRDLGSLLSSCETTVLLLKGSCSPSPTSLPKTSTPTLTPNLNTTNNTTPTPTLTLNTTNNTNSNSDSTHNPNFNSTNASTTMTTLLNVTTTIQPTMVNSTVTTTLLSTLTNVKNTTATPGAEETAAGLLNLSNNASSMTSSQLDSLVSQLELLLNGPNVSLGLGTTVIKTVSNLLNASQNALASSSKRLIGIVDTVGLKLVVEGQTETILSQSLALAVKKVDGAAFQQTTFTMVDSLNLQIGSARRRRKSVEAKLLSPQGSILLPSSLLQNLTTQQQQVASRVQFNFYQKSTFFQDKSLEPNKSMLISGVLSASVNNLSISNLRDNVIITLRNTKSSYMQNYTASCVFWNFVLNGGAGGWSPEGCSVLNSTEDETVCSCNHLTSFGVLLNIFQEGPTDPQQALILTYITYIGCGISAIFLSVTLLTYLSFEKLRKDIPSKILIHLCLALLMLNLVFLLDSWLALYTTAEGLCISTAFFLHYFLLASFTWMALEAVHMYIALVKVFNTYVSRFMIKLGLAGWGIPLVVVIIVIAIDKNNYGLVSYGKVDNEYQNDFCWVKNPIAFYVAVVAYFCVVFLMNLSMFIVVMVQLCRIKKQNPQNMQHRSGVHELRSVAGLTVLLGLTWGFAFFAWGVLNLPFMYLFAIFNSLQGFFIFVFHCAVKENVRRQWRTYLCCGRFRLAENSDWSHTATQKTKKSTVNRFRSAKSSTSNNSSSSSTFLVSDSSGSDNLLGISNPIDDRTITAQEEQSYDVVLNEINHTFRDQRSQ